MIEPYSPTVVECEDGLRREWRDVSRDRWIDDGQGTEQ